MVLDDIIQGKVEGIAETMVDGLQMTILNIRSNEGHLHTIYAEGHRLYHFNGQEVDVSRRIEDHKKENILIVEQVIGYHNAEGIYVRRKEYQQYP